MPCTYDGSPLNTADALPGGPARSRPGSPCPDVALGNRFLLDALGGRFTLLTINADAPDALTEGGIEVAQLALTGKDDATGALAARYLGEAPAAVYLIRPDQHVAARFPAYDEGAIRAAIRRATGQEMQ
jgi:3-(3-hydroxy-phenyl)propionate hydroxylase